MGRAYRPRPRSVIRAVRRQAQRPTHVAVISRDGQGHTRPARIKARPHRHTRADSQASAVPSRNACCCYQPKGGGLAGRPGGVRCGSSGVPALKPSVPGRSQPLRMLLLSRGSAGGVAASALRAGAHACCCYQTVARHGQPGTHTALPGARPGSRGNPCYLDGQADRMEAARSRSEAAAPGGVRGPNSGIAALPRAAPAGRRRLVVQRSVHPQVSTQYQRTSAQALPPSGTRNSAGRRMPHIQHASMAVAAAPACWGRRLGSVMAMISSPPGSIGRDPGMTRPANMGLAR
jgi:hypothetical protein